MLILSKASAFPSSLAFRFVSFHFICLHPFLLFLERCTVMIMSKGLAQLMTTIALIMMIYYLADSDGDDDDEVLSVANRDGGGDDNVSTHTTFFSR